MNARQSRGALPRLVLGALLAAGATTPSPAQDGQTTVHVIATDGGLAGEKITADGNLIGVMGDFIALSPGQHQIWISAAQGYTLRIGLTIDASAARVTDYSANPRSCGMAYEVLWEPPGVFSTAKKPTSAKKHGAKVQPAQSRGSLVLRIATPQFGAVQGKAGCLQPMSMSCQEHYAKVHFVSNPSGAEIWVGDEKQDAEAPVTLSVPFCSARSTVHVMMRVPGMTTCPQEVELSNAAVTDVQCTLNAPAQPATVSKKKR